MAWVMPESRCCPSCGYSDRILVLKARNAGYRLSCGWCALLSERSNAHVAFFQLWGAPPNKSGHMCTLEGVPHWFKGQYVESVPIRVINNGTSATVVALPDPIIKSA